MVRYRMAMRCTILMATRSTIIQRTLNVLRSFPIVAATNPSLDIPASVGFAERSLGVTRNSVFDVARNVGALTTLEAKGSAVPAYNITVEVDECYFVRGSDDCAYLVSNSSHSADAFGALMIAAEKTEKAHGQDIGDPYKDFKGYAG